MPEAATNLRGQPMSIKTVGHAKRCLKIAAGFTLLLLGLVMMFLPGPGILTILAGLGLLAADFVWAKRLLGHLDGQHEKLRQLVFTRVGKTA